MCSPFIPSFSFLSYPFLFGHKHYQSWVVCELKSLDHLSVSCKDTCEPVSIAYIFYEITSTPVNFPI